MTVSEERERSFNPDEQGETPEPFATVDPQLRPLLLKVQHESIPALGERPFLPLTVEVLGEVVGTDPYFNSVVGDFIRNKKVLPNKEHQNNKKGLEEEQIYALTSVLYVCKTKQFSIRQNINWKGNYGESGIVGEAISLLGEERSITDALSDPYPLTEEEKLIEQEKDENDPSTVGIPSEQGISLEILHNREKLMAALDIFNTEVIARESHWPMRVEYTVNGLDRFARILGIKLIDMRYLHAKWRARGLIKPISAPHEWITGRSVLAYTQDHHRAIFALGWNTVHGGEEGKSSRALAQRTKEILGKGGISDIIHIPDVKEDEESTLPSVSTNTPHEVPRPSVTTVFRREERPGLPIKITEDLGKKQLEKPAVVGNDKKNGQKKSGDKMGGEKGAVWREDNGLTKIEPHVSVQPLPASEVVFDSRNSRSTIHIDSSEVLREGSEAAHAAIRQLREERAKGKIPIQEIPGYVDAQQQTTDGIKQGDSFRDSEWNLGTCERLEIVDGRQYVTVLFAKSGFTARFPVTAIERGRYIRLNKREE